MFRKRIYFPLFLTMHRIILYFTFFCFIFTASYAILSHIGSTNTDLESARYLLSTLIGSEATVLAIVVTLSLVVVQLTIPYSPKVSKTFRNFKTNPDFYIILVSYLFSFIYGAWVLKQLSQEVIGNVEVNNFNSLWPFISIEEHIRIAFCLGIISFMSLVLYIPNTMRLLDPSNVIKILASEITRKKIRAVSNLYNFNINSEAENKIIDFLGTDLIVNIMSYEDFFELNKGVSFNDYIPTSKNASILLDMESNPLEPLIDMIINSLNRYEFKTAERGLEAIRFRIKKIFYAEIRELDKKLKFRSRDNQELDENSMVELNVGTILIYLNLQLFEIGKLSIEKKAENCVEQILISLYYNIYFLAEIMPESKDDIEAVHMIKDIATMSLENKAVGPANRALKLLEKLSIIAISESKYELTENIIYSLKKIRKLALEKEMSEFAILIDCTLKKIVISASKKGKFIANKIEEQVQCDLDDKKFEKERTNDLQTYVIFTDKDLTKSKV